MAVEVSRGDVILVNLEPVVGSEQGKTRPVLVIQNDTGNKLSPTTGLSFNSFLICAALSLI